MKTIKIDADSLLDILRGKKVEFDAVDVSVSLAPMDEDDAETLEECSDALDAIITKYTDEDDLDDTTEELEGADEE